VVGCAIANSSASGRKRPRPGVSQSISAREFLIQIARIGKLCEFPLHVGFGERNCESISVSLKSQHVDRKDIVQTPVLFLLIPNCSVLVSKKVEWSDWLQREPINTR